MSYKKSPNPEFLPMYARRDYLASEKMRLESLLPLFKYRKSERRGIQDQLQQTLSELRKLNVEISEKKQIEEYARLKAFVLAAKRRMAVDDYLSAWAEVDEMALLGNLQC